METKTNKTCVEASTTRSEDAELGGGKIQATKLCGTKNEHCPTPHVSMQIRVVPKYIMKIPEMSMPMHTSTRLTALRAPKGSTPSTVRCTNCSVFVTATTTPMHTASVSGRLWMMYHFVSKSMDTLHSGASRSKLKLNSVSAVNNCSTCGGHTKPKPANMDSTCRKSCDTDVRETISRVNSPTGDKHKHLDRTTCDLPTATRQSPQWTR